MRLRYRVLCLSSILLLFLFGFINYFLFFPPTSTYTNYIVGVDELLQYQDLYEGYNVIIWGEPYNVSSDEVYLQGQLGFIKINCSYIDVSDVTPQINTYFLGTCRLSSEGQVIAQVHHVLISYSLLYSLIGLVFIVIILFVALKFHPKKFSWELRRKPKDA
ncbi:MAG: hypothetical protein ACTSRW_07435 [Candidatus Helarchaeota archaeon]